MSGRKYFTKGYLQWVELRILPFFVLTLETPLVSFAPLGSNEKKNKKKKK